MSYMVQVFPKCFHLCVQKKEKENHVIFTHVANFVMFKFISYIRNDNLLNFNYLH
jgi:CRISPR/Cas system-associated protein Csx1